MFYNLNCQYLDSLEYIALAFLTVCSFYDNIRFGPASVDVKHELQLVLNTTGASTGNYITNRVLHIITTHCMTIYEVSTHFISYVSMHRKRGIISSAYMKVFIPML